MVLAIVQPSVKTSYKVNAQQKQQMEESRKNKAKTTDSLGQVDLK